MKILFVITGLGMGGAENQVVTLAEKLVTLGHDVGIAYILKPALVVPKSNKVKLLWLEGNRSILGVLKAYLKLAKLIKKYNPDVIHSHMYHANILARLVRLIVKMPKLVCTAHSNNEGGKLRMLAYRVTDSLCEVFTNVSNHAVVSFEAKGAAPVGRMITVYNGIDTKKFSFKPEARKRLRKELNLNNKNVFIAVGRFAPEKDYPNMLKAFALLQEKRPDTHLLIVGDGELRPQIESLIKTLKLEQFVTLLGVRKDIPELLSAADIFVLSSAWEGFGLVVAEAMSVGIIVVATDCGGVAEIVKEVGFLSVPQNSNALFEQMSNALLLQRKNTLIKIKKGKKQISSCYELTKIVEKWLTLYNKL